MASHPADQLPEPDHEMGYSESFLVRFLGEHMVSFREYMLPKTYSIDSEGPVYRPSDVRRFVGYYVRRTARPLTEAEVRALFDSWDACEDGSRGDTGA